MPGLNNSESRQVTHDSQGLRVTVRIADDSTSNSNNNNNMIQHRTLQTLSITLMI